MNHSPIYPILFLTSIMLACCSPRVMEKPFDEAKAKQAYSESIGDAAKPQPWEIRPLTALNDQNPRLIMQEIAGERWILVSSWKEDAKYYKNDPETGRYNTGNYPIWVTIAPEMQLMCQDSRFGRKEGLNLRLEQLLGLPPGGNKQYVVEFWVRTADLFRPCPDPEVTDGSCGLAFPEDVSEEHKTWINNLRLASYYNPEWNQNYPWTELGYTYDWNPRNKTHTGLSEFVIGKNKDIIVKGIYTTEEYCTGPTQE